MTPSPDRAPFTRQTRVADALAARPELRELLPAFHPAFARLNHPVLGKVLPKLVNLEQAAAVAGVDPDALVEVCNLPGAPAHRPPPSAADAPRRMDPPPPWPADCPVVEVDARPLLEAGQEPFAAIMAALRTAPPQAVVRILAPFEPAPLVDLVGKRGWVPHVTWQGDCCVASFWRPPGAGQAAPQGEEEPELAGLRAARLQGEVLDVRGLEPPLPLQLVLATVEQVLPLTVLHEREPALLWPRLAERGLAWTVTHEGEVVRIHIIRAATT